MDAGQTTLLVGIGSPLRGDDGLGLHAIRRLASEFTDRTDIRCLFCPQLTPDLAVDLLSATEVFFIDASRIDPPGEVRALMIPDAPGEQSALGVSHGYSPARLLALTADLYGHRPLAMLYTVGAGTFDLGEALSPQVATGLEELLCLIRARLTRAGG